MQFLKKIENNKIHLSVLLAVVVCSAAAIWMGVVQNVGAATATCSDQVSCSTTKLDDLTVGTVVLTPKDTDPANPVDGQMWMRK